MCFGVFCYVLLRKCRLHIRVYIHHWVIAHGVVNIYIRLLCIETFVECMRQVS